MISRQLLVQSQKDILSKIDAFLQNKEEKHISIVLGPYYGKTTMAMILAQELSLTHNVIYLNRFINRRNHIKESFESNSIMATSETIRHFLSDAYQSAFFPQKNSILIIDDAQDDDIFGLQQWFNSNVFTGKTISFLDPTQETAKVTNLSSISALLDDSIAMVQTTSRAIDVRLCLTEEPNKCGEIRQQFLVAMKEGYNKLQKNKEEQNRIEAALNEPSDNSQIIANLKADNTALNEGINALRDELAKLKNQFIVLETRCRIQEEMLSYFGISKDNVLALEKQIDRIRHSLEKQLLSQDKVTVERASHELQNKVAVLCIDFAKKTIKQLSIADYTDRLTTIFSARVWNKLTEISKDSLITANYTYHSMNQQEFREKLDYSGVCLLVTKTVEIETNVRFFEEYKVYLHKKFGKCFDQWPVAMTKKDRNGTKYPERVFTLGSVVHIVGCVAKWDPIDRLFMDYALTNIYPGRDARWVETELRKVCDFVERVRLDYRNPATHKDSVKLITATECLNYVVNVQRKLKAMLETMSH